MFSRRLEVQVPLSLRDGPAGLLWASGIWKQMRVKIGLLKRRLSGQKIPEAFVHIPAGAHIMDLNVGLFLVDPVDNAMLSDAERAETF